MWLIDGYLRDKALRKESNLSINTNVMEIIAKRKAIEKSKFVSPTNLVKSEFEKGLITASNQINEWLTTNESNEIKEKIVETFILANKNMYLAKNNKNFSYWSGLSYGLGRYYYSGLIVKK